ncbi:unnamed protein product [Linum tenue]|uniref:GDSL esterase/lipase n=1 Tax=Linum tenue TaxID=586396 RepID=A0AAV0PVV5_9ROSI|nr:unnamed protein product [Linum tenue]
MVVAGFSSFAAGEKAVPCYFIFGDSLADNGNNNWLQTVAKVDYSPYGVDFRRGATGRFTNGRNIVDFFGPLALLLGAGGAYTRLGQCLYTLGLGNNDFLNNYFRPEFYPSSRIYTVEQFAVVLANRYKEQLQRLYVAGARKIGVFALGQIGCVPFAIRRYGTNGSASGCAEALNDAAVLFNVQLKSAIDQLQATLPGAQFVYIGSGSDMLMTVRRKDPTTLSGLKALEVLDSPCCTVEAESGQCVPDQPSCPDRSRYVFWDWFHPTEALNSLTAAAAFEAVRPIVAHSSSVGERSMIRLAAAVQAS